MKISLRDGLIHFIDVAPEEESILEVLRGYQLKLEGGLLQVKNSRDETLVLSDLVDNSTFIVKPTYEAATVANALGGKRFVLAKGEKAPEKSQLFSRDRDFGLDASSHSTSPYRPLVGLEAIKSAIPEPGLYSELAALFRNYADFTETKKLEYAPIDQDAQQAEQADKYCRFNNPAVLPIVMVNSSNEIMGCIRLFLAPVEGKTIAYLSDEIVKYSQPDDRETLMAQLFNFAREELKSRSIMSAFIRVADGRQEMYQHLGCSATNENNLVIHGAPSPALQALQAHVKGIAKYKLPYSQSSRPAFSATTTTQQTDTSSELESSASSLKM